MGAAALVVVVLLVLHTNPVQSRILQWSVGELERRFDLDLMADNLHFNLAARRVVMTNVRLAALGHHDDPFFTANTVTVRLPWAAYRGMLQFDEIGVDTGHVTINRDANGISNLPPGRGRRDPDAPARRIDIRALVVRQLDFVYLDHQRDLEIRTPQIRTDLTYDRGTGASGPMAIERDLLVRVRNRRVTIKPVEGRMIFDGSNVELAAVRLDTSEGSFVVGGDITRALDRPTLDLVFDGTADIARAAAWTSPPMHLAGEVQIKATMTGAPTGFVLESHVTSAQAEVGAERGVRIEADSRLTPNGVTVTRSTITPSTGGEVHATLDVPFGAESAWWIAADYRGVDAATAFRLAEVRVLPFGAALSGTARLDRRPGEPFTLELHNVAVPRNHRGTAPLAGEVEFFVAGSRWRANQRHRVGSTRVDGRIGGVWNRQAASRSTFEGTLAVNTGDIGEAARYAALFGLTTPAVVRNAKGPLEASVSLGGIFTEPRFAGRATSTGVDVPSVGTASFTADFDASPRAVTVTTIDAAIRPAFGTDAPAEPASGSAHLRGEVLADLVTRRLSGSLAIESASAADLFSGLPASLRLDGALAATVTLAGTVDAPDIRTDVESSGLRLAGQSFDSLVVQARVVDEAVNVESLVLRQGAGELKATGRYVWTSRTYVVDLDGQGLTWRGTLPRRGFSGADAAAADVEARLALKFSGAGSIDRPAGEGVVEFQVSGGPAGELIDRGLANVRLNGDTALVTVRIPSLGALVTAHIVPRHPFSYDAVVVMNRIALEPVVALAGLQQGHLTGTASLSASAKGALATAAQSDVFVNLQDIEAQVSTVPLRLTTPARLSWDGSGLTVDALDLAVGQGQLRASGRLGTGGIDTAQWTSTYTGELGELLTIGRPFGVPSELEAYGPVNITWRSTGGLDQSTATLQLTGGSLAWGALPAVRELTVDARFDGATLALTRLTGRWQDGSLEGTASIPKAVLEARETGGPTLPAGQAGFAKLKIVGLNEQSLAPWLSRAALAGITGRVSATLDTRITRASLDGVTGTLTLDEADLTLAGVKVSQVRPAAFAIEGGLVTVTDVAFDAGGSPLTLTGTARLLPRDRQVLDLNVRGTADLTIVSAFAPTIATGGTARINMGIGGALASPVFNGRIDIAGAEVAMREPRIVISELNGTIALDGKRIVFDSLTGSANGGILTLDGGLLLDGFTPTSGGLTAQIQRAAIEYPQGLQSEADALVTLQPNPAGWTLTGDIRIERSAYTEPISLPSLIAARRSRAPVAGGDDTWGEQLRLNLFVFTQQDLRLDNNYGRLEAGAALRVAGTVADPALSGRVTLREGGEVYLAGNTFHLSRGSISFTNPNRIVPEFDVELRTLVAGTDLALTLEGPLDRLETEVRSSNPDIDSREAMAMLFGGFQGEDAVALLSAELLGATGRAIGLDTLRVERGFDNDEFRADPGLIATETDPSTRLTVSKRLRPDVELILSQSLRESGRLSAVVSYKPRRNIELRAVSRDNIDRSLALRHEITFGGGGASDASTSAARPEVSAVTISGDPRRPEPELRALLSLTPGEDFDFHTWQRDLDDLREVYQEEQHYEARVRGTRRVSDDGATVALDYHIEPGPTSELVIDGHPLEPELEEDLRDAWMRTIFDRFLLEDIRTRINRHLMAEGFIGSSIQAVVAAASPERKQIRVSVTAGTAATRRIVRYIGPTAFDDDRLDSVIQSAGLDVDGWLDPRRIAEAIEEFYRGQGYLAVTVAAESPRVEAGLGILPVTIDEGQRFLVGRLTFPGVSPGRLPSVAGAVRLDSGVPFVTSEIDAAQERVEELYAREGFNTVQIEIDTVPDLDNGSVDVTIAVLEGLQQILRDVTTDGASRTRDGVIRRALRLRVGEPVNLADWSQARKRLYDTNVFRQVDIEPVLIEPTTEDSAAGIQPVRAVVRVVEYPVWRLRYGAQFNDEHSEVPDPDGDTRLQSLGLLADLQNQNVFGRAITAGIAGRYERNRQAGSLFTSNGSFFGLPIRSSGFIFASRQRFLVDESVTTIDERVGLSAEQRWRPFRTSEVIWSYRLERSRAYDPDLPPGELQFEPIRVSRVNAAVVLDRRDDPSDPARGWFTAVNWDQAVRRLGSDYSNAKLLVQQSMYRKLGGLILAGRAQLGSGFGDEDLIVSERFLLGGATTVRGYGENALGPRDVFGLPAGGDALLALNAEVRFPVRGWVQGVGFVDAGNVFAARGDLSLRDLFVGYGLGLRLASPFAMLRVDFGIPAQTLNPTRPANQLKSGRWYFGIGHIF